MSGKKNGSVGRDFFFFFFFFFFNIIIDLPFFFFFLLRFIYFATQTTEMHILAVMMLHQHKFGVYKGKRKLK